MYSVKGGGVNLYTYDNLFQYKIENGVLVKRSEEELEKERKEQLENPDYSKIAQEVKDKLEHFLYNPTLSETKNPDNLGTGIYQYLGTYFDTSPFQVPHVLIDFNAQSLRFQIGADFKGNVVFRSRGATETEWTLWKNIEDTENKLRNMGLLSAGIHNCEIKESFTFDDLIHRNEVTFFSNWSDSTNFPFEYGSGILIPGSDVRFKYMLYTNMCMMGTDFDMNLKTFIGRIFIPNDNTDDYYDEFPLKVTWEVLSKPSNVSNPNLLINSDFKICQRNMAEYITNKTDNDGRYYPDRWICARDYNDGGLKYKIEEDGLHAYFMSETGSWGKIEYRFDKDLSDFLSEKVITISGKIKTISDNSETRIRCFDMYNGSTIIINQTFTKRETDNFYKTTIKLPKITDTLIFNIRFSGAIGAEYIFEYLKLELGNEATLYTPPDPAQELIKCKYYYQRLHELRSKSEGTFSKISYVFRFSDYYVYSAGDVRNYINCREAYYPQMRCIPTVKLVGTPNSEQGYYIGYIRGGSIDTSKQWTYTMSVDMQHIGILINEKNGKITDEDFNLKELYFTHDCYVELDAEVH